MLIAQQIIPVLPSEFVVEDGVLIAYTGTVSHVVIPADRDIAVIGMEVFYEKEELVSVVIPESVTQIEDLAFGRCTALTEITLPSGLTRIGSAAFSDCEKLTRITLPAALEELGNSVFERCTALTEIEIPEGITVCGAGVFEGCSALTSVMLPDSLGECYGSDGEADSGESIFNGCVSLTRVVIEGGRIPDYTLRIPAEFTVYCYELSGVAGWAERNGYSVSYLPMLKLNLPRTAKCVEEEAFAGTAAQVVVLPDGCTDIGPRAFAGSDGLRFVYMPDSVERIADDAFEGCGSVTFLCESENAAAAYAQRYSIPCVVE